MSSVCSTGCRSSTGASRSLIEVTAKALADGHLGYFVQLSRQAAPGVQGPDEPEWVVRLNAEFDNLRVAHAHAIDSGDAAMAVELVASLHDYVMWRQRFELGPGPTPPSALSARPMLRRPRSSTPPQGGARARRQVDP